MVAAKRLMFRLLDKGAGRADAPPTLGPAPGGAELKA